MKNTLTLYYSVSNGGDGSAYPQFSLSKDLAEIHQDIVNLNEGWGEDCTGEITLQSDSPITVLNKILINKDDLLESLEYYIEIGLKEAIKIKERIEKLN